MRNVNLLPVVIGVALLAFSVRVTSVYTDVRAELKAPEFDAFLGVGDEISMPSIQLSTPVLAASDSDAQPPSDDGLRSAEADAASADEYADNGYGGDEAYGADAKTQIQDNANKGKDRPVWHDAVQEDFAFEDTKDQYLDKLEGRRKSIEKRERDLAAQEALLKAARQEMDRKYQELSSIKAQLEDLLREQEGQEKSQVDSLVMIYEGMKAKDAATIFNSLDLDVLLKVTQNMNARKISAIFAKMNPERAKTLTEMLAEQKSLSSVLDAP